MATKRQMIRELRRLIPDMERCEGPMGDKIKSIYIGSFMSLDPCGRYHHILSPNGVTQKCEAYWERLEAAAEALGGTIEGGEGDPTDIYFVLPDDEE